MEKKKKRKKRKTIGERKQKQEENTKTLNEYNAREKIKNAIDINTIKTQQAEAAQLKINVSTMQNYLDIVRKGNKNTTEYQNAVNALAKAYPEAANAEGIIIKQAQDYINQEKIKADQAWNTSQTTIEGNMQIVQTYIEMAKAADTAEKQQELANKIGIAYSDIIPTLTSVLNI